jgi:hypothetical protein
MGVIYWATYKVLRTPNKERLECWYVRPIKSY